MKKPPKPPGFYYFNMNNPYVHHKPTKTEAKYLRTRTKKQIIEAELPAWTDKHPEVQWLANRSIQYKAALLRCNPTAGMWGHSGGSIERQRLGLINEAHAHFRWEHHGPPGNQRHKSKKI